LLASRGDIRGTFDSSTVWKREAISR